MICWLWDKYKIQKYLQLADFMFFVLNSMVNNVTIRP